MDCWKKEMAKYGQNVVVDDVGGQEAEKAVAQRLI